MPRQLYGAIEAGGTKFVCAAGERIIFGGGVIGAGRLMPYVRKSYARVLNNYLPIEAIGDLDNYIVTPGLSHRSGIAGAFLSASEAARRSLRL